MGLPLTEIWKMREADLDRDGRKGASQVAQMVKNPPAKQEPRVQSLSWEDPLG